MHPFAFSALRCSAVNFAVSFFVNCAGGGQRLSTGGVTFATGGTMTEGGGTSTATGGSGKEGVAGVNTAV